MDVRISVDGVIKELPVAPNAGLIALAETIRSHFPLVQPRFHICRSDTGAALTSMTELQQYLMALDADAQHHFQVKNDQGCSGVSS